MQKTYIFGHRNPDTDSVCSTIALAHLKKEQGYEVIPKILSDINKETKYVLDYFNVEKPEYLNDVKIRIKDIKYEKKLFIKEEASILDAYDKMFLNHTTAIPIVNDNKLLTGYVTLKEIAKYLVSADKQIIKTTSKNIIRTLKAEILTEIEDYIEGRVIVAGINTSDFNDLIELDESSIVVVGNRPKILNYAIDSNVALIILTYGSIIDKKLIAKAKKNNIPIIITELDSFNIANKIGLSNYISYININYNPVVVHDEDYYFEFKEQIHKKNHTNYPVLNKKGECLGLLRVTGSNSFNKRKVILVDHNAFDQTVVGIEESEILEIIDHHNLGAMGTNLPISFRSMPVGSTATIIYKLYLESKVVIPKDIAGLLLSAIISDTLLFTSPTTTEVDKDSAEKLSKLAKVNLEKYGIDMLKAGSAIENMSIKDIVYNDYKSYNLGKKQLGISVVNTMDFDTFVPKIDEIVDYLNQKKEMGYDISVMFVTDIIKNGSYIIYDESSSQILKESFGLKEIYQGIFVENLVSRKKQMLPNILETYGITN